MRSLREMRDGLQRLAAEEERLRPRERSVQEAVAEYVSLIEEFHELRCASQPWFEQDRADALAELQRRLARLPKQRA